jgi:hypothetical protein
MKLTKYQKARLLEYEWNVVDNETGNTFWVELSQSEDGETFDRVSELLDVDVDNTDKLNLLIVATQLSEVE